MSTQLDEINHPHLSVCLDRLSVNYDLFNRLNDRIRLIKNDFAKKTDYEKNEIEITIIRTKAEIESQRKIIAGREDYFKNFVKQFAIDLAECENNFDTVMSNAKEKAKKNDVLRDLLYRINWAGINTDSEAKVKLYQRVKEFL